MRKAVRQSFRRSFPAQRRNEQTRQKCRRYKRGERQPCTSPGAAGLKMQIPRSKRDRDSRPPRISCGRLLVRVFSARKKGRILDPVAI